MKMGGQKINYLTFDEFIELNRAIVEETGGKRGPVKEADVDFLVFKIRNDFNFPNKHESILYKGAYIIYFINHLSHPFADGNKRTAIEATKIFFTLNGFKLILPFAESKEFIFEVSQYKHTIRSIFKWLRKHAEKN